MTELSQCYAECFIRFRDDGPAPLDIHYTEVGTGRTFTIRGWGTAGNPGWWHRVVKIEHRLTSMVESRRYSLSHVWERP